jgi:hypothetical protein
MNRNRTFIFSFNFRNTNKRKLINQLLEIATFHSNRRIPQQQQVLISFRMVIALEQGSKNLRAKALQEPVKPILLHFHHQIH